MTTKTWLCLIALAPVMASCAAPSLTDGGTLTHATDLRPGRAGRAVMREKRDVEAINRIRTVFVSPAVLPSDQGDTRVTPEEQRALLREIDAHLCFELSERFEIVSEAVNSDAVVRTAVTGYAVTGNAGSAASAAAQLFIPGPVSVRVPGGLGSLSAEAEMTVGGTPVAAIVWSRRAQAVGTDTPSLSRLGDALQFAEPFADDAARVMSPDPLPEKRSYARQADPCAGFGDRVHESGIVTTAVTGLYIAPRREPLPKSDD